MSIPPPPLPSVSVVIPVRDGARGLERAVRSALAQDHPGRLEVVVAVAPSRDESEGIAARLAQDSRVRTVPNPTGGTAAGLNAAIAAARGDVIVRCDAMAELPSDYVTTALGVFAESGAAVVGGMQVAEGGSAFERAVALATRSRLGAGDARHRIGGRAGPVDTVYLGVFRRAVLERVGGYDERFVRTQDAELNHRFRESGETVWFDPRLRVSYRPRSSLGALWRQYFEYGWWKRMMARIHRGSLRMRQLVPVAFVLGLILSAAMVPFVPLAGAILPGLYVAAVLGATVVALASRRDPAALLLPIVFPTIHLAWGFGFLAAQLRPVPE